MATLLLIRYATLKKNSLTAIEFNNERICTATSLTSTLIAPGIYSDPPNDFSDLSWFDANDLRMDKTQKFKLLTILTDYTITQITVI
jgi:hypothetical protein